MNDAKSILVAMAGMTMIVVLCAYSLVIRLDEQIALRKEALYRQDQIVDRLELIHHGQMRAFDTWNRTRERVPPGDMLRPGWKPDALGSPGSSEQNKEEGVQ